MNKLQNELCAILCKLISILECNKIDYWLAYGSVLGAVRHDGFIPWDDDVDIYINGKDYQKLQKLFSDGPIDGLRLDDAKTCENYPFTFPKIVDDNTILIEKRTENDDYKGGIYIDVFPLYSVSKLALFRYAGYISRYINYAIVESHYANRECFSIFRRIIAGGLRILPARKAQQRLMRKYYNGFNREDCYLSEPQQFNDKNLHIKSHFNGYILHAFEYVQARIPEKYHDYLISQYGDYMKLPPEEERVPGHNYVFVQFADGSVIRG